MDTIGTYDITTATETKMRHDYSIWYTLYDYFMNTVWDNNLEHYLTHCGLATLYGDRDLGQYWLR